MIKIIDTNGEKYKSHNFVKESINNKFIYISFKYRCTKCNFFIHESIINGVFTEDYFDSLSLFANKFRNNDYVDDENLLDVSFSCNEYIIKNIIE